MTNKAIQAHQYENPPEKEINKHAVSDIVYRILAPGSLSTYKDFATTDGRPEQVNNWTCFLSLEYIHDSLHVRLCTHPLCSSRADQKRALSEGKILYLELATWKISRLLLLILSFGSTKRRSFQTHPFTIRF